MPLSDVDSDVHELIVRNLTRRIGNTILFSNISFSVRQGETLFIRGPSGVGKSLLLRQLSLLDETQDDPVLLLDGENPAHIGITKWRTLITYVSQSRAGFTDTPAAFYFKVQKFAAQRGRAREDLPQLIHYLGLEQNILEQPWSTLSGGQAQRVQIAIAVALNPIFLLLDEPTSALDPESTRRVERLLKGSGCGLIWVSHDPYQPNRVGGQVLDLPGGLLSAVGTPPLSPETLRKPSLPGLSGHHEIIDRLEAATEAEGSPTNLVN